VLPGEKRGGRLIACGGCFGSLCGPGRPVVSEGEEVGGSEDGEGGNSYDCNLHTKALAETRQEAINVQREMPAAIPSASPTRFPLHPARATTWPRAKTASTTHLSGVLRRRRRLRGWVVTMRSRPKMSVLIAVRSSVDPARDSEGGSHGSKRIVTQGRVWHGERKGWRAQRRPRHQLKARIRISWAVGNGQCG